MATGLVKVIEPTVKCASTACGLALGGFLGGAVGGMVGAAFGRLAGEALGELGKRVTETAIEKGSEFFVDKSAEPLIDHFRKSHPTLEDIYREAFRLSLYSMRPDPNSSGLNLSGFTDRASAEYADWFDNWDFALRKGVALSLGGLDLPENDLQADSCFKSTLERIDAQGGQLRGKTIRAGNKITIENPSDLPVALFGLLRGWLPERFVEIYKDELVKEENRTAFNEKELQFQQRFAVAFVRLETKVDAVKEDTTEIRSQQAVQSDKLDAILKMLGGRLDKAIEAGTVPGSALKERDDIIARQAEELEALRKQVAVRAADPARAEVKDAELSKALEIGDLDAALRLQTQQTERASEGYAREFHTLGIIYEMRFEWLEAIECFRKAASEVDYIPENAADTFRHLGALYKRTKRMEDAKEAYENALDTYRRLAETNSDKYLPKVSMTLSDLAYVYIFTRTPKAEGAYKEAIDTYRELAEAHPDEFLPKVSDTLNELAFLYSATQRMRLAEQAYREAAAIDREFAEAHPIHLYKLARTLENLAVLYSEARRMKKAERVHRDLLSVFRKLSENNPVYLDKSARTLTHLAKLYRATRRTQKAEEAYREALASYREMAELIFPEVYLTLVALTLNNLADLYLSVGRVRLAETAAAESERTLHPLWEANPARYGNSMAKTFWTQAVIQETNRRPDDACSIAHRALAAASDSDLKQSLREFIERVCPKMPETAL